MVTIQELWQPILLASVLAFFAGFVLYMLLPLHARDWSALPDEAGTMARLREARLMPGGYVFPCPASPKEMATPEFVARLAQGPVGIAFVRPTGRSPMGPSLGLMVIYHLVISVMVAYVAGRALAPGVEYLRVFQIAGATALLGYAGSGIPFAIWYRPPARYVINQLIDGVVWALLTAGSFGWLWPR
jgi:hypothetical protein